MSKETKARQEGRLDHKAGKVEVEIHVEPKPEKDLSDLICVSKGEYEQLKRERDAFKSTVEKLSSMYFNKCEEFAYKENTELSKRLEFANRLRQKDVKLLNIRLDLLSIIDSLPFYRFFLKEKLREIHSEINSAWRI